MHCPRVHRHNWEKWALLKVQYPLEPGCAEQVPGQIPEEIYEQLKNTAEGLGSVRRYGKAAKSKASSSKKGR